MTEQNNIQSQPRDIMHYESDIWAIADLLLAASVKQSDFPAYMMPFFALMMLEGRMLNAMKRVEEEEGLTVKDDPEDFKEAFIDMDCGYNEYIVMEGKTLSCICSNDTTFEQDFDSYLKAFDDVLKKLLGIERGKDEKKYLNMDYYVAELRSKKILLSVITAWSKIDLSPYDNSAITTLEEHIKRKWADISASTAGEQYTPDDIISLIADIVATKVNKPKDQNIHVYDPTCGGANLLFGVADRLQTQAGYKNIHTWGSEYNDALYALAAIESRFRSHSHIYYGNTLTTAPCMGRDIDVIVANPPYGTKWSGYEKEIKNDQKGQFPGGLPSVSDGQLLFMQHILWQLDDNGIAVEVHNGSTLFSGDAGSGESNIRKYIFDHDWVEAIIQMPQNEFFNTGIYTYLWIMNKQKPFERQDKVALIDGSKLWRLLKKAKGDKRREMTEEHRTKIVQALTEFKPSDICKIFDREHFYYNKQSLTLTEVDVNGDYLKEPVALKKIKSVVLNDETLTELKGLDTNAGNALKNKLKAANIDEDRIVITLEDGTCYSWDQEQETVICESKEGRKALGCGTFKFDLSTSKGKKSLKVVLIPRTTADYEIIPHHFDEHENLREIDAFMQKYVFKPYVLGKNVVGVEVNYNKEFYVPDKKYDIIAITKEIKRISDKLETLVYSKFELLDNVIKTGLNHKVSFKDTEIDGIGLIPKHWKVRRLKEIGIISSGMTPNTKKEAYYNKGKHPWLNTGCVQDCEIHTPADYVTDLALKECKGLVYYPVDTILIAMYGGGTIGNVGIMRIPATINQACCALSLNKKVVLPKYVFYSLYAKKKWIISRGFGGTQVNLSQGQIANFAIEIPPIKEQISIVNYLDEEFSKIDVAIKEITFQIDSLKLLRNTLTKEIISGQLHI
ncbi:MAG: N-6 DNA methylase [Bacteroidaceae bacterium]|nr:N-6 DNA methylase [Bacteroidaceae bacterium]